MEGLSFEGPKATWHTGTTNDEIATVEDYLSSGRRKLSTLNITIAKLQSTLTDLKLQRDTLNTQLDNYRSLIAPIRQLLPEILQEIFKRCLPTAHNSIMSRREVPLLLCCVCRRWRQIALSTPQLWASIHIVIPDDTQPYPIPYMIHSQRNASLLSAISSWLSRSGSLPLSISVSFSGSATDCGPRTSNHIIQPYLDALAVFKSRWRSIHLSFVDFDWTASLSQFNANDLLMLENIYISGPLQTLADGSGDIVRQELIPLARDSGILLAPRLRSIAIPFGHPPPSLQLPIHWENLTGLEIIRASRTYHLDNVAKALLLCPRLETLSISLLPTFIKPGSGLPRVDLPNLYSISFIGGTRKKVLRAIHELFQSLHTPQLRHLAYEESGISPWDTNAYGTSLPPTLFLDSLSTFLSRLALPLEELDLGVRTGTDTDVIGILQLVPELKRLSLRDLSKPQDIIRPLLTLNSSNQVQCYFQDVHLVSLTPPGVLSGMEEKEDGIDVDDEPSASSSSSYTSGALPQRSGYAYPICPCPKLEVFNCAGAAFSGAALLRFLRSRSRDQSPKKTHEDNNGVARLRKVNIVNYLPPGDREWEETRKRIEELQATNSFSVLNVTFVPTIERPTFNPTPFSSYDGADRFGDFTGHSFASRRQDLIRPRTTRLAFPR